MRNKTVYDTLLGSATDVKKLTIPMMELIASREGYTIVKEQGDMIYCMVTDTEKRTDMPLFIHPVTVEIRNKCYIVIDQRPFISKNPAVGTGKNYVVSNTSYFDHNMVKLHLTAMWLRKDDTGLKYNCRLAARAYCAIISNLIGTQYNIESTSVYNIKALVALFYGSLFRDGEYSREDQINDINKFSRLPIEIATPIVDMNLKLTDLNSLADAIIKVGNTPKLAGFKAGVIVALTKNIFFGYVAKENIIISLEYPPYWTSMVYMVLTNKSYRKNPLSNTVNRISKQDEKDELINYMKRVQITW